MEPPLSSRSVSDILTVMSLITPGDPVTGGMQTLSLPSVNSLMLQAQQILVEVKDLIQKATNTARVQRGHPEPRCCQPRAWVKCHFLADDKRYVLLCATPLCSRYGLSVPYYCASLQLGPNTTLIIRATFLLQGGMRLESSNGDPGNNHAAKLKYPVLFKHHIFLYQSSVAACDIWLQIQLSTAVFVKWKQATAVSIWVTIDQWWIHTRLKVRF